TFTRQDAERLARIETKLDSVLKVKEQTIKNTTAIKYIKWVIGSIVVIVLGLLTT
ncbi:hypothetical protein LCGC14_2070180, partial [marine sediment metagenome]